MNVTLTPGGEKIDYSTYGFRTIGFTYGKKIKLDIYLMP